MDVHDGPRIDTARPLRLPRPGRRAARSFRRRGSVPVAVAVVVLAATLGATVVANGAAGAGTAAPPLTDGFGLHVETASRTDARTVDVRVRSASINRAAGVRILLPDGYDAHPGRHYPVLYLLHGGAGTWTDWTALGAAASTAGREVIVVMPDGGKGGWYTDWQSFGAGGPPKWETFHIGSLVPWVDANLRTIPTKRGRAIAGLSMGGYGAMNYAGRHPELFTAVSAYSGAVDINNDPLRILMTVSPIIDGMAPGRIYGVYPFDSARRLQSNPWQLAPNYRGMRIALYTGNGLPGPLDAPIQDPITLGAGTIQEGVVHLANLALDRRLTSLGIAHELHAYGNGQHSGGYWARDLAQDVPGIVGALQPASG
jgi:S-formylglutathione hydrolase FrmB